MNHRWFPLLLLLLLVLPATRATAQDNCQELVCLSQEQHGASVYFFVENRSAGPVTMHIEADLDNMATDIALPYVATFPARLRTYAFALRQVDVNRGSGYQYRFRWNHGSLEARPDDGYVYALPYKTGERFLFSQGPNGAFSHRGMAAYDWTMPEGTPVLAAREGVVVALESRYHRGGTDPLLKDKANFVMIAHADGTMGRYVHLLPDGVTVRVGDRVQRGQRIGYSGHTGYSTGPHLHFEVYTLARDLTHRTRPVRFDVGEGNQSPLREGELYTAPAANYARRGSGW